MNNNDAVFKMLSSMLTEQSFSEINTLRNSFQTLKPQIWSKDHYFFRQDVHWNQMILIQKGVVRCFYIEDDKEINLRFLCGGSVVLPFSSVAMNILDNNEANLKSNEYIQSVSEVKGYILPLEYICKQKKYPELNGLRLEIAARHYLAMEQRLRMIQHHKALDRYKKFLAWMPREIIENMPNQHVASYLGMTPESLSRLKHCFKE